jgi:hypothetical protein
MRYQVKLFREFAHLYLYNYTMHMQVTVLLTKSDGLTYLSNIKRKLLQCVCQEQSNFVESSDGDLKPLKFWNNHAKRFPRLSLIARSVFAIPASQNKAERAFSAAGHTMTDLRTNLDPEHLDDLLVIRSVKKLNF